MSEKSCILYPDFPVLVKIKSMMDYKCVFSYSHQLIRSDVIDLMGQPIDLILPTRLQKVTPPGGHNYPLLDNGN